MASLDFAEVPSLYRFACTGQANLGGGISEIGNFSKILTFGNFLRFICQVNDCPNRY